MLRLYPILFAAALAGCGALSALEEASTPLEVYELRTPPVAQGGARRGVEVIVEEPLASGSLSTERIMIRPSALQAQYLPGVRWADPAPAMLQTLLVRSLGETGALGSVSRRPVGPRADYAVLGELTDFQAEATEGEEAGLVRVRFVLRVVRERDARVVATRSFEATELAASADPDIVVAAFDSAVSRLLPEAVGWIVAQAR
ncbi:membrane integrity-associated transporter subunit PqiC [Salipiger bermudensis]|uniref:ABC-type transport auxiliary lipoprotein family protein n=1 Tax=Salipiger bermudensis TaxID=344736 RepID=UPI001C99BEAE|nr:ABC-type transport auxiliary lipoprotein family protein [Salipiger bermudensis]MBY6004099.1 membrane integrity-associated transporter subunit PqiC [Salipiger bermudensis]